MDGEKLNENKEDKKEKDMKLENMKNLFYRRSGHIKYKYWGIFIKERSKDKGFTFEEAYQVVKEGYHSWFVMRVYFFMFEKFHKSEKIY